MLLQLKKLLRERLPQSTYQNWRRIYVRLISRLRRNSLRRLAELHGTDKIFGHNYIDVYEHHFCKFRKQSVTFLEIGVGGYNNPQVGGQSLRMWKDYFYKGRIYSIDIYDKSPHQQERIRIFQGSQADRVFLESVHRQTGGLRSDRRRRKPPQRAHRNIV